MKNTENTIAKKLTLEEIKALPKASVVWMAIHYISDDSIVFHTVDPVMVWRTSEGSGLIGCFEKGSYIDRCIDESLLSDPNLTIWDLEPADNQLEGISQEEYDKLPC